MASIAHDPRTRPAADVSNIDLPCRNDSWGILEPRFSGNGGQTAKNGC